MHMNEQELCKKRLTDLSKQANRKGIVLFSDFLNLNELHIYHQSKNSFETQTESFGGVPHAERQMIAFIPDALYYEWKYPITALCIQPASLKFAEELSHRDILGAVMQLGVDRSKLGDIIVGDNIYYLLCEENIAGYFMENLTKIRHTAVTLKVCSQNELVICQEFEEKNGIIASNRLDSVIACVHKLSRSQALELFRRQKVYVNGRLIESVTYTCQKGDIVSVRGYGRFIYAGESGATNKGRMRFCYQLYKN